MTTEERLDSFNSADLKEVAYGDYRLRMSSKPR